MAKEKIRLRFPDGSEVEAEPDRTGQLAVHRPTGSPGRDYVVTCLSEFSVVMRTRLKGDATKAAALLGWARKSLGDEHEELYKALTLALRQKLPYKTS